MDGNLQSKIWEFGELSFNIFDAKKVDRKILNTVVITTIPLAIWSQNSFKPGPLKTSGFKEPTNGVQANVMNKFCSKVARESEK